MEELFSFIPHLSINTESFHLRDLKCEYLFLLPNIRTSKFLLWYKQFLLSNTFLLALDVGASSEDGIVELDHISTPRLFYANLLYL